MNKDGTPEQEKVPDPPWLLFLIQGLTAAVGAAAMSTMRWCGVRRQYLVEEL